MQSPLNWKLWYRIRATLYARGPYDLHRFILCPHGLNGCCYHHCRWHHHNNATPDQQSNHTTRILSRYFTCGRVGISTGKIHWDWFCSGPFWGHNDSHLDSRWWAANQSHRSDVWSRYDRLLSHDTRFSREQVQLPRLPKTSNLCAHLWTAAYHGHSYATRCQASSNNKTWVIVKVVHVNILTSVQLYRLIQYLHVIKGLTKCIVR